MGTVLFTWLGRADLDAARESERRSLGPIARAATDLTLDELYILSDWGKSETQRYAKWLEGLKTQVSRVTVVYEKLSGPMRYDEVYEAAVKRVRNYLAKHESRGGNRPEFVFHLSPGTPAMQAVWLILGKTLFPARLIVSSIEHGVEEVSIPFDMVADYRSDSGDILDDQLLLLAQGLPLHAPEFDQIAGSCTAIREAVTRARILADSEVPLLILGETGTGKEVFARAIWRASKRGRVGKPFVALNCGALTATLMESELFGHKKGAFTGAACDYRGAIERAHSGVLFLDELGELTPDAQTKLLRAIQEKEIMPLGGSTIVKVDFRLIAATNRNLVVEISKGNFRSDLFWRVCVGLIQLPPLRERGESDIQALINMFLEQFNDDAAKRGRRPKHFSAAALKRLREHAWPGNVRELQNTLIRAALFAPRESISPDDVERAIIPMKPPMDTILNRPLSGGFDIEAVIGEVMRHYLCRAGRQTHWNKSRMWELLKGTDKAHGYKDVDRWMAKYGVSRDGMDIALK